jgi:hypothetical protein
MVRINSPVVPFQSRNVRSCEPVAITAQDASALMLLICEVCIPASITSSGWPVELARARAAGRSPAKVDPTHPNKTSTNNGTTTKRNGANCMDPPDKRPSIKNVKSDIQQCVRRCGMSLRSRRNQPFVKCHRDQKQRSNSMSNQKKLPPF